MTLGNVISNVLATTGGALVGGSAGAFTASNADLYNRSSANAEGKGGTGNDFVDRLGEAIRSTAADPLGALNHALNSLLPASGPQPDADPNPLVQANDNGKPPATGGSVVTPSTMVCIPNQGCVIAPGIATPGTSGYAPGNATLSDGENIGSGSNQALGGKNINDLSDAAKVPDSSDKSGELSAAGRALQKHGGRDNSAFPFAKGNPAAINDQGHQIVHSILNDPGSTVTQRSTGRFGDVIDITAPDGRGVRYSTDGKLGSRSRTNEITKSADCERDRQGKPHLRNLARE
jgi:filamentous hemagglutinin